MNFFETMRLKNMKQKITKRGLPVLLKYAFIKFFEDNSQRDFNFSSWSIKFHQKAINCDVFFFFTPKPPIFWLVSQTQK